MDLLVAVRNAELSPLTIERYEGRIGTLCKRLNTQHINDIVANPDINIPKIKQMYPKHTTYKGFLSVILVLFKYNQGFKTTHPVVFEKWLEEFKKTDDAVNVRYESNKPSDRQKEGYVPYADIVKKRDTLPPGSVERLLLGMYTHIRPMRCEYARVAIYKGRVPDEPEPNHILLRSSKLIINHFKTRRHHDGYVIDLPKPLIEDLTKSLQQQPREWLFVDANDGPFELSAYSKWTMRIFKKLFGRSLSVALIRHSFINSLDFNSLSIAEKKEIALSMGHTMETQDRYRLIFADESP